MSRVGVWPPLLLGSAAAVVVVTAGAGPEWLRAAVTTWFLLACPGAALVLLLPRRTLATQLVFAVATGLALETLLATTLVELKAWSPRAILDLLASVTVAATAARLRRALREQP